MQVLQLTQIMKSGVLFQPSRTVEIDRAGRYSLVYNFQHDGGGPGKGGTGVISIDAKKGSPRTY